MTPEPDKAWTADFDWRSWSFGFGFQSLGWAKNAYIGLGPLSIHWTSYKGEDS